MALILVVEDDEANLELITLRSGHFVRHAVDGEGGVKAAHQYLPDVILMDLGLPGLDGWQAAAQIRASNETRHIPLIALTAHALSEDVRKATEVGFNAYETKPLVYQRLMKKIGEFVKRT